MTGGYVVELPPDRRIAAAPERAAIVGRARSGPLDEPVVVATEAAYDAAYGAGDTALRRAVAGYLAQGADPPLVVRTRDLTLALAALAGTEATLLVVGPSLVRGREAEVERWCADHLRFWVVDCPDGRLPPGAEAHTAGYTPRLRDAAGRRVWTAAAVAGVVRRMDRQRGVWKAPAGSEADLRGLTADPAPPAPEANLVRRLTGGALVLWGTRTASSDLEWRYVNVRRTLLFLERSIDAGLAWTVFEPNDEPLWLEVRRSVEDFLTGLWRSGAFVGTTPDEAFFVRCDRTTMTQNDLDSGRLVCLVGVAPVRPAEFVLFRITRVVG